MCRLRLKHDSFSLHGLLGVNENKEPPVKVSWLLSQATTRQTQTTVAKPKYDALDLSGIDDFIGETEGSVKQ